VSGAAAGPEGGAAAARQRLTAALAQAVIQAERRSGHGLDRPGLAKRLNVSTGSLYAYLNGTTLARSAVFDRLLGELGVSGPAVGRLSSLRDAAEVAQRTRRAAAVAAAQPAMPRPRQLPSGFAHFVDREAELEDLESLLAEAESSGSTAVAVIDGMAGIGKTALALQWAHQVQERYPDGQLHVNLRGFDRQPPMDPDEALHGFLQALGVPANAVPAESGAKSALLRSLLAGRRVLVLADNARSAEQVRPLLPGAPGCLAVVTSRDRLDGLAVREGARRVTLGVLSRESATALLGRQIGAARLAEEPEAAAELVELCARLPLALSVAGARAAVGPGLPLGPLAEELRQARGSLDGLGLGDADIDLRSVFHSSYAALPEPEGRLFRLLGVHPGPDIDGTAAAALLGTDAPPRASLAALTAMHLIVEESPGRYSFHDLLRAYARELTTREPAGGAAGGADEHGANGRGKGGQGKGGHGADGRGEHRAAAGRVLDHYLRAAVAADQHLRPWQQPAAERSGGYAEAMAWFEAEIGTLHAVIRFAVEEGRPSHAWRLAWACAVFLRRTGRLGQRADVQRIALDAAAQQQDGLAEATCTRLLADALARMGRRSEASALLRAALAGFRELRDDEGARQVHLSWVRLYESQERHREALPHAEQALALAAASADPSAEADGLTALAKQLGALGQRVESLALSHRALSGYSGLGHSEGEADILLHIGQLEHLLGRQDRAAEAFERSLALDRALGDTYWAASALVALADVHDACGEVELARARREEGLLLLDGLHHPDADRLRTRLHPERR
jgi:tetratricopeptide (TPR) repeat protein